MIAHEGEREHANGQEKSPGHRLVIAIGKIFPQMMPSTPPRHGKRLDTRWGEFGILASQYFAPLQFGIPVPASLREAWGRIDKSILLFAYGKPEQQISEDEMNAYKLVGDETEVAPNSTLSDWNRKGLQRLFEIILARENYLSQSLSIPPVISRDGMRTQNPSNPVDQPGTGRQAQYRGSHPLSPRIIRIGFFLLGIIFIGLLLLGGYKAFQIYELITLVRQDAARVHSMISAPGNALERLESVAARLSRYFSKILIT